MYSLWAWAWRLSLFMLVCKEKKGPKKRKCYLLLNFIYINKYYTMLLSVMAINQIFLFWFFSLLVAGDSRYFVR